MICTRYIRKNALPKVDCLLSKMLRTLEELVVAGVPVIPWACPVPSFGNPATSIMATLGINPSNREFVDGQGNELTDVNRRLHTLNSLNLVRWTDADKTHRDLITVACSEYFERNPYHGWFRSLDQILHTTNCSYFHDIRGACHLDLVPFATAQKWTSLPPTQRRLLLSASGYILAEILRDSPIRILLLNGKTVVNTLEKVSGTTFRAERINCWTLPRRAGAGVYGIAYRGTIFDILGVKLRRPIEILGYNHNIQSSFGVTSKVKKSIQEWVAAATLEIGK